MLKKYTVLLFTALLCNAFSSLGQSLNLEQLISIQGMDEGDAGIFLTNKGWEMDETTDKPSARTVYWQYGQRFSATAGRDGGPGYEIEASLSIVDSNVSSSHYVTYTAASERAFNALLNKAVSIGMKRIKYSNDGKSVVYVYQGQKYTVKFEVESVTEGGLENFKYRTYAKSFVIASKAKQSPQNDTRTTRSGAIAALRSQ